MEKSVMDLPEILKMQFGGEIADIRTYSPLALAYIGDGIYDLVIRTLIVRHGSCQPNKLHKRTSALVKASAQSALIDKLMDKLTEEEASRRNAAVCLMCTKPECTGAAACYQQRKKNQQRIYQADRRSAERALNAFYNAIWEQERRERLNAAHKAFHEQRAKKE